MEMVLPQRGIMISSGGDHHSAAMAPMITCRRPGPRPATPPPPVKHEQEQEQEQEEGGELRRGPWTVDEDMTLVNYIADHGEGRWNALARAAGLKRTGKSCRLRWLNYLRPDVRRGDFTADEQLLILDLHSRWGNRWSKIAQQLPGRTDNEIKNYWRTRVQKHAKQLNCDVNSARFKDAMRCLWMPRLAERASQQAHPAAAADTAATPCLSALTTAAATTPASAPAAPCAVAGNSYYGGDHSPTATGSSSGNMAVACTSSSDSSLTSESTATTAHEERSVPPLHHHHHAGAAGVDNMACDGDWPAAMQQQGETTTESGIHDFWSSLPPPAAMPQLLSDDCSLQFQDVQDLSGWVQGFSEGITESAVPDDNNLWSLDDMIWRMQ